MSQEVVALLEQLKHYDNYLEYKIPYTGVSGSQNLTNLATIFNDATVNQRALAYQLALCKHDNVRPPLLKSIENIGNHYKTSQYFLRHAFSSLYNGNSLKELWQLDALDQYVQRREPIRNLTFALHDILSSPGNTSLLKAFLDAVCFAFDFLLVCKLKQTFLQCSWQEFDQTAKGSD